MTQSRYSVLLSFCLLILLTAGFFEASRLVFNKIHSSVAAAIATATPIVLVPTATPAHPKATAKPSKPHHAHAQPTATPEQGAVKVLVAASLQQSAAATAFPGSTPVYYCMVDLPNVPSGTPITFKWESLPSGTGLFTYTGTYNSSFKYSYVDGPFQPGQDRCSVFAPVNGSLQLMGSASFTVQ